MLEKIPRAIALRAIIVVSPIVCSPPFLAVKLPEAPPGMPIGGDEE